MAKVIKNYPNYIIFKNGKVKNIKTKKVLSIFTRESYPCVALSKDGRRANQKIKTIHKLLAQAYLDNPKNLPIVNHINGNKSDYRLVNLEWCTYKHNNTHAFKTGLNVPKKGDKSHAAKLSLSQVKIVRRLLSKKVSQQKIAVLFSVSRGCIQAIASGKSWKESYNG